MDAWEAESATPEYPLRKQESEQLTEKRRGLKEAAHTARRQLTYARKLEAASHNRSRSVHNLSQVERRSLR